MQQAEVLSLAGLRLDGRKSDEIRRIQFRLGLIKDSDGSAYLEQVPFLSYQTIIESFSN